MKYYVVSDLHGFYTETVKALQEKGFFEDKSPHKLVVLGDLFDRGKEAKQMQSFILDLLERGEVILIRGNHEDLMLELLDNAKLYLADKSMAYGSHHAQNGTFNTVFQLIESDLYACLKAPDAFEVRGKRTPFVQKIIPAMVDYYETKNYIFVHGWIPCRQVGSYHLLDADWRNATKTEWKMARWLHGIDCHREGVYEDGKTIVCGHWHCSYGHYRYGNAKSEYEEGADFTPYYDKGLIAIDACTALSGFVNCVVIEDEELA